MKRRIGALVAAFALSLAPVWAQTYRDAAGTIVPGAVPIPHALAGGYSAQTIGAADATILAGGTAFYFLDIANTSSSATVCVAFGATATISGTQCAAGEIALPPLWHRSWEGSFVPTDAVHAIASAASTQVTVGAK